MIKTEIYEEVLFETVKRGATEISDDVHIAFENAIKIEDNADAKAGLSATLASMQMSGERKNPLCVDTGWPIFYFKVGNECKLEGGFVELERAALAGDIRTALPHLVWVLGYAAILLLAAVLLFLRQMQKQ